MRREKRWRYYCDYCGKSGASGGHMSAHEKHCTKNPERVCRFCERGADWGMEQQPISSLVDALGDGRKSGMDALYEVAQGCPACMLSAIRQSGVCEQREKAILEGEHLGIAVESGCFLEFDFKKMAAAFWSDVNEDERHNDAASYSGCW